MSSVVALEGPVELIGGTLALRIPIARGARRLLDGIEGIGEVDGKYLRITIPDDLGFARGSVVVVTNRDGAFSISPSTREPRDESGEWSAVAPLPKRKRFGGAWGIRFDRD